MTDLSSIDARKDLAAKHAEKYGLDVHLVCAVAEQESGWDPWAIRFEPAFYERYTKPMKLSDTEEYSRAISWGLMQIMGETARELGFRGRSLAELCDPDLGLDFGCAKLAREMKRATTNGVVDLEKALLGYNGGKNKMYPGQVLGRVEFYVSQELKPAQLSRAAVQQ